MNPDTPTIFLVGVVILGLAAGLQWLISRRLHPVALRLWAAANLSFCLGGLIYLGRQVLPQPVVQLVGNGLFLLGLGLIGVGIDVFEGARPRLRELVAIGVPVMIGLTLVLVVAGGREDIGILVMSLAVSALVARAAISLLRPPNRRTTGVRVACAAVMLAFAAFYLIRGIAIAVGWLDPHDAATGPLGGIMRVLALTMATTWSVGSFVLALDRVAATDDLTGLMNRRAVMTAGSIEVRDALASGRPLSVLMIDLDHFKRVNDDFGHQVGDTVLQAFADTALRTVRAGDVVGRLGGEEFCVVLPGADAMRAIEVAERLRTTCESALGLVIRRPTQVTVSIGVATLGQGEATFAGLVKRADGALYRAKARGRDLVVHADVTSEAA